MKVVITGGAGFIGKQLAERLSKLGELPDAGGKPAKIDEIVLFDAVEGPPPAPGRAPYRSVTGDVADRALMRTDHRRRCRRACSTWRPWSAPRRKRISIWACG